MQSSKIQLWARCSSISRFGLLALLITLGGCGGGPYAIEVMPRPVIYDAGAAEQKFVKASARVYDHPGVLYATSRPPHEPIGEYPFYQDERGGPVRLGLGVLDTRSITSSNSSVASEERRDRRPVIAVSSVNEFGILNRSLTPFSDPRLFNDTPSGDEAFAEAVEERMKASDHMEITIYVHGYKVPFVDPVLVTAEFWHITNYEGAFIAFSWPSTPSFWAYFADADTTAIASRGFRDFLEYLADATSAERINIIAYSAGTRMVLDSLHQIALTRLLSGEKALPLGDVILTAGDVDRGLVGVVLEDRVLEQVERLTLYVSEDDQALGLLSFLGLRDRIGQAWKAGDMPAQVADYLRKHNRLVVVNVSAAEGSGRGNGHGYFRNSPWVSSDIIATLLFDLPPQGRGLVQREGEPTWDFPDDYPTRLRNLVDPVISSMRGG